MELKIKRIGNHDLPIPEYSISSNSEIELRSTINKFCDLSPTIIKTGFAFKIPKDYVMVITINPELDDYIKLINGILILDSNYRDEIELRISTTNFYGEDEIFKLRKGIKIAKARIIPCQSISINEVDYFDDD